ncbi:hypothetical protein VNO77_19497 [Canavalia gladiata]|uniref:Uncharacterized protein n=1 Tax=Canavalia gladiata TaxID=3824 RepID=A0AAN9LRF1_CANGL
MVVAHGQIRIHMVVAQFIIGGSKKLLCGSPREYLQRSQSQEFCIDKYQGIQGIMSRETATFYTIFNPEILARVTKFWHNGSSAVFNPDHYIDSIEATSVREAHPQVV